MKIHKLLLTALCAALFTPLFAIKPTKTCPLYSSADDKTANGFAPKDEYTNGAGSIFKLSSARIDIYLPEKGGKPSAMILAIPGGGYQYVSSGNEGVNVADYFVPRGYAVAVLKYRLPNNSVPSLPERASIPLTDALQAMRLLRDSAEAWNLDPHRIGCMGFSAGGHLAASLLTGYTDAATRPDFGVLVYPVITMDPKLTHKGSRLELIGRKASREQTELYSCEKHVTTDTPPCIIVACQDDPTVNIENSLLFYKALTDKKVPSELVIVPEGKHGWGFMRQFPDRDVIDHAILNFVAAH